MFLVFFLLLFAYVLIMFTVERTKVTKLAQKDDSTIKMKYTTLKINIKTALENKVEKKDAIKEVIKEYIRDQFCDKDDISKVLQKRDTISDVFDKLNEFKMWDYSTTDKLFTVAEVFLDDDEDIMADIEDYRRSFLGHEKCILIKEMLSENPSVDISLLDPTSYMSRVRKECTWKIIENEETHSYSLKYLKDIWQKLDFENFEVLNLVLDGIHKGCMEVVWYIPSATAQAFIDNIKSIASTLQEFHISASYLESASIFDGTNGIASERVGLF